MNQDIRGVKEVRLINADGTMSGVVAFDKALAQARAAELDLCEISPTAVPPVCRIMDFGKHVYQQKKKDHENQVKHRTAEQKQLRLRSFRIDKHDLEIKTKQTRFFIEGGHRVLFTLQFRARENDRPQLGAEVLLGIAKAVADVATVAAQPAKEGKKMTMLLVPVANVEKIVAKRKIETARLAKEAAEKGLAAPLDEPEILPEELRQDDSEIEDDDENDGAEGSDAEGGAEEESGAEK
jgi:translation initiation factor IF-3